MPRDGSGQGDNSIEGGHDIIHGAGKEVRVTLAFRLFLLPLDGEQGEGGCLTWATTEICV
jgi:hypothetical protein